MNAPLSSTHTSLYAVAGAMLAALAWPGTVPSAGATAIAEPSTVFYGKVVGTGGAQPYLLQEGQMVWTLRQSDGSEVELRTTLYELNQGEYSYRLDIPHAVLTDGPGTGGGLPLPPTVQTNQLVRVFVDGEPALFAGPTGASFKIAQAARAATYRLDLELGRVPEDADGDGVPDWWEDAFGLNADDPSDAGLDLDGDGLANLDEYLRGLDPTRDSRMPLLATTELLAFPGCTTGIRLVVQDTDSTPADVVFTLVAAPAHGQLVLRNQETLPGAVDKVLAEGDTFTLDDVNRGLLVLSAPTEPGPASIGLSVRDEASEHPEQTGTVDLAWFKVAADQAPATTAELRRRRALALGTVAGAILWDEATAYTPLRFQAPTSGLSEPAYLADYTPAYGDERFQVMTSGRGDDWVEGGMADDLLVGGRGTDVLVGNGGADLFVFDEGDLGTDTIEDFTPEEGDVLDLAGVLRGAQGWVDQYLTFEPDGTDTRVGVDLSGQGADFTDLVITLAGTELTGDTAFDAVLGGRVEVGALRLQSRVTIGLADAEASENGNNSGTFTVKRDGDLGQAVQINLSVSGSAQNGVDYALVANTVTLPAGQAEIAVTIRPFADSQDESPETVEVVLLDGNGYRLGSANRAELQIQDLQAVVGIEVLESLSSPSPSIPGLVLLTRNGKTSESLVVRLRVGGSAENGEDYAYLSPFVTLQPGQTAIPLEITQLPQAVLADGAETVTVTILADPGYARADTAEGRVVLVANRDRFATWMAREFPDITEDAAAFAASDPGQTGTTMLQRYAFGMNPQAPSSDRLPTISLAQGHCLVRVHRHAGATDIRFEVERSADLITWQAAGGLFEQVDAQEAGVEVFRSLAPVKASPKDFLRVKVIPGT